MRKLIALMLVLCMSIACFAAFAEEAKEDASDSAAETAKEDASGSADGEELDEKFIENISKLLTYGTIHDVLDVLDLKDNDMFKAAEKEAAPVIALSQYLLKNGDAVKDAAELAKTDELKEYADFFAGKNEIDPQYAIDIILFINSLKDDEAEELAFLGLADGFLKFAYGLEVLGSEIEDNDILKGFKSILEYAETVDDADLKEMIADIKSVMDGFLKDDEVKAEFKELAKIVSGVSEDKLNAVVKEIADALGGLENELGGSGSADEAKEETKSDAA